MTNNAASAVGAVCAGMITYLFGVRDALFNSLLTALVLDYATGVVAAYLAGTLSSKVGFKGLAKKFFILCIVAMANILDNATGAGGMMRNMVLGFYIANEALSLVENGARLGVPMPEKLKDALAQINGVNSK
ncbi:holin family protein [uncultured Allofournierella sp.]|uniref:phage holin family protein n=1 Tax=uncultured Allofournierella sp. TaxID=1940258 RepID=UPI0037500579